MITCNGLMELKWTFRPLDCSKGLCKQSASVPALGFIRTYTDTVVAMDTPPSSRGVPFPTLPPSLAGRGVCRPIGESTDSGELSSLNESRIPLPSSSSGGSFVPRFSNSSRRNENSLCVLSPVGCWHEQSESHLGEEAAERSSEPNLFTTRD